MKRIPSEDEICNFLARIFQAAMVRDQRENQRSRGGMSLENVIFTFLFCVCVCVCVFV